MSKLEVIIRLLVIILLVGLLIYLFIDGNKTSNNIETTEYITNLLDNNYL